VRNTFEHTGIALVLTSLLLVGGFAVMVLSDFTPTADFGLFTSVTVLLALLTDLLFLPSLLSVYQRSFKTRLQYAEY
jgi:predicted RND superfamily exporter protein